MYFAARGALRRVVAEDAVKVFQPFLASAGLVAEGVIDGRPASLNPGLPCLGLTGEGRADRCR